MGPASKRTVLVVDDDAAVRMLCRIHLEEAGFRVVEASDGDKALETIRADRPDVVLLDIMMPRVSGWQVARAVKQIAPRVPVFLVTGFGIELSPEERRAHGVDVILVKPLQIQEILDALAEAARKAPPAPAEDNRWPFSI